MAEQDVVLEAENEHLAFRWRRDASAEIVNRATGNLWRVHDVALQEDGRIASDFVWHQTTRNMCEEYAGHFRGVQWGDAARFTLFGRMDKAVGAFTCRVRVDGPWLVFRLEDVDDCLPSLIFPPAIEAESLVLPQGIGRWLREPMRDRAFLWPFTRLTMRWFGGLRGDEGWLGIISEGIADAGVHVTHFMAAPGWLKSHGRWSGPREVRYRFTTGGYVGLAKAYRAWAAENGLLNTLREKMAEDLRAEHLAGGPMISIYQARPVRREAHEHRGTPVPPEVAEKHGTLRIGVTHAQAAEIVRQARAAGMKRGIVNVRGWIPGGYDNSHPDALAPRPGAWHHRRDEGAAGPGARDRRCPARQLHGHVPAVAILPARHHRELEGRAAAGRRLGRRAGMGVCQKAAVDYARRNWEAMKVVEPDGIFLDTTAAQDLWECYHADHPATRAEDLACKTELLSFFRRQGLLVGSEEVSDFAAPVVHWFENRHRHVPGESIPLWPLVFHDCNVCYRYSDPTENDPSGHGTPNWLADMLWGYALLYHVRGVEQWGQHLVHFGERADAYDWHRRIALDEMTDHRFLSEDRLVEQTTFASGASIVCNFAGEERQAEGRRVPAGRYAIVG